MTAAVVDALDLREATSIGFSTGGEVACSIGRHDTDRVPQAILVSAVPPIMVKGPDNPNAAGPSGAPHGITDTHEKQLGEDVLQFVKT